MISRIPDEHQASNDENDFDVSDDVDKAGVLIRVRIMMLMSMIMMIEHGRHACEHDCGHDFDHSADA